MLLQELDPASGVFLALGRLFPELLPPLIGLGGGGAYFAREFLTSFVLLSFVSVCVCVCELIPRKRKNGQTAWYRLLTHARAFQESMYVWKWQHYTFHIFPYHCKMLAFAYLVRVIPRGQAT